MFGHIFIVYGNPLKIHFFNTFMGLFMHLSTLDILVKLMKVVDVDDNDVVIIIFSDKERFLAANRNPFFSLCSP